MFDQLKNLIPSENEKFVIAEGGEPRYVVMSWREFEMMRGGLRSRVHFAEVADEVLDVPMFAPYRRAFAQLAVDAEKIRLEDLPV
ncbi:MAG: hypothetical protein Q7R73_03870 [bacterium]|nr:hypothetical protein [bacterium]